MSLKERKIIVDAARVEAQRMRAAIASTADGEARIAMTADQFATLAGLLDSLASTVEYWPEEQLDDPRYWVPLGHFQRVRADATRWQAECDRLAMTQGADDPLRF